MEGRGGYLSREKQRELKPLTTRTRSGAYTGIKKSLKESQFLGIFQFFQKTILWSILSMGYITFSVLLSALPVSGSQEVHSIIWQLDGGGIWDACLVSA